MVVRRLTAQKNDGAPPHRTIGVKVFRFLKGVQIDANNYAYAYAHAFGFGYGYAIAYV
jgi:hypothetical protein